MPGVHRRLRTRYAGEIARVRVLGRMGVVPYAGMLDAALRGGGNPRLIDLRIAKHIHVLRAGGAWPPPDRSPHDQA